MKYLVAVCIAVMIVSYVQAPYECGFVFLFMILPCWALVAIYHFIEEAAYQARRQG